MTLNLNIKRPKSHLRSIKVNETESEHLLICLKCRIRHWYIWIRHFKIIKWFEINLMKETETFQWKFESFHFRAAVISTRKSLMIPLLQSHVWSSWGEFRLRTLHWGEFLGSFERVLTNWSRSNSEFSFLTCDSKIFFWAIFFDFFQKCS